MTYKFLAHTADIKVEVQAKNLEQAFISSSQALKEVIAGKIKVKSKLKKTIKVQGRDKERLLYEFLEQFLYLLDAEDFLPSKIKSLKIIKPKTEVKPNSSIKPKSSRNLNINKLYSLEAEVLGDKASDYKFSNDVKAITYNDMKFEENKNKVKLIFVLDV